MRGDYYVRDKVPFPYRETYLRCCQTLDSCQPRVGDRTCTRAHCESLLQRTLSFPTLPADSARTALPRVGVFLHEGAVPSSGERQSQQSGLFLSLEPPCCRPPSRHPGVCSTPCTSPAPSVRVTRETKEKEKRECGHADALLLHQNPSCRSSSCYSSFFHIKVPLTRRRRRRRRLVLLWRPGGVTIATAGPWKKVVSDRVGRVQWCRMSSD